jgi:O-antigen ligase
MNRVRELLKGPVAWALALLMLVVLLLAVGRLVPSYPIIALAIAAAVLLLGLTLADPTVIPLLSLPLLLVVVRVSVGGVELSVSDVVLFVAFWPAVVLGQRPYSPPMRALLWLTIAYQVATLFTVVANPYTANAVEWFHAWFLTGGALVVGWALGRAGRGGVALSLLLIASCIIAVATIAQGMANLGGGFQPVYPQFPFPMHKNFAGTLLAFAALVAYIHPSWMRWPRFVALAAFGLCTVGVLMTQSRQAIVGLAIAIAVAVLREDSTRRRSKLLVLAGVGGLAFVATVVRDQVASGNQFNSVFQRINWLQDSVGIWLTDPVFGVGLRWWYTDRFEAPFQPPNAELEVLTSAGVLGVLCFLLLMIGAIVVLWKLPPVYGTLGAAIVLSRFVQGQFDLFWTAVQVSVPFVVAGICVGAAAQAAADSPEPGRPAATPLRREPARVHW